jgi:flagellar motility protein MotE (MotC chaperone)
MQLDEEYNRLKVRQAGEKERLDELNDVTERMKRIEHHIHTVEDLIKQAFARKLNHFH